MDKLFQLLPSSRTDPTILDEKMTQKDVNKIIRYAVYTRIATETSVAYLCVNMLSYR